MLLQEKNFFDENANKIGVSKKPQKLLDDIDAEEDYVYEDYLGQGREACKASIGTIWFSVLVAKVVTNLY